VIGSHILVDFLLSDVVGGRVRLVILAELSGKPVIPRMIYFLGVEALSGNEAIRYLP